MQHIKIPQVSYNYYAAIKLRHAVPSGRVLGKEKSVEISEIRKELKEPSNKQEISKSPHASILNTSTLDMERDNKSKVHRELTDYQLLKNQEWKSESPQESSTENKVHQSQRSRSFYHLRKAMVNRETVTIEQTYSTKPIIKKAQDSEDNF